LGYDPAAPDFNEALEASKLPLIGGIVWGLAAVAGIGALLTRRKSWLWGINLVGFVAFLILTIHPAYLLLDRHRQLPLRQIATTIDRLERSGEPIVMVGFEKPSLVFYTQKSIAFFSNTERTMAYLIERSHNSSQPESVLLVGNPDRLEDIQEDLALQPSQYREIDKRGAYQLVRVSTASPLNWAIDPEG
jgi:4-amino-4-deoxy-L-arabinose transferase-like glycosyltransferase